MPMKKGSRAKRRYKTRVSGFHKIAPSPDAKERKCLRCRAPFMSEWAGNRICERCKTGNESPAVARTHPSEDWGLR